MPRWPFWPASIGCLTLVISVTRSAASTRRGSASRPVITTCWWPGPVAQRRDDVVDVDPAPLHRVGELVEHVEVVASRSARRRLISRQPSAASAAWSSSVPCLARPATSPRPSCATRRGRPRRSPRAARPSALEHGLLADAPLGRLHELEDPDAPALVPAAQRQPEGGGRLALAVAGVDHQQRPVAALPRGQPVVGNRSAVLAASGHAPVACDAHEAAAAWGFGTTSCAARALFSWVSDLDRERITRHFFLGSSPRAGEDGKSS